MEEYTSGRHARQLTRRQRDALPHLIAPGPVSEKARNAGISRNTMYRWLRDGDFRRRLKEACNEAMSLSDSQLQLASHQAVTVLFRALEDENSDIRLRAAQSIVKLGQDSSVSLHLEEKVNVIEDAMHLREELKSTYP